MTDNNRLSEEQMETILRDVAAEYHVPPATPREAIWARIAAERERRETRKKGSRLPFRLWRVAAAIAAVLVVGILIGRVTAPTGPGQPGPQIAAGPAVGVNGDEQGPANPVTYRVAASEHLGRVETFLTVFRAEARAGRLRGGDHVEPARRLLLSTRLLQDSPAAQDVALQSLLEDVEVVLAQIAQYGGDREDELEFINQGIEQRSVLLKLRAAAPADAPQVASQGAL